MTSPAGGPSTDPASGSAGHLASPETGESADESLPPFLAALSLVVFTAVSVLSAVIEVTLVPLRHGTTVVPITVALAAIGNWVVPTLSRRAVPVAGAAIAPAVAWVLTVIVLSSARPEGDVLLVGTKPLEYVTYGLLAAGILSAMVAVVRGQARQPGSASRGAASRGAASQGAASRGAASQGSVSERSAGRDSAGHGPTAGRGPTAARSVGRGPRR